MPNLTLQRENGVLWGPIVDQTQAVDLAVADAPVIQTDNLVIMSFQFLRSAALTLTSIKLYASNDYTSRNPDAARFTEVTDTEVTNKLSAAVTALAANADAFADAIAIGAKAYKLAIDFSSGTSSLVVLVCAKE